MKDIKSLNENAAIIKFRAGWIILFLVLIFILGIMIFGKLWALEQY
jgi:hypothetical protein